MSLAAGVLFFLVELPMEYFSGCGVCLECTEVCATWHMSVRKPPPFRKRRRGFATDFCMSITLAPSTDFSDMTNHARPLRRDMCNDPLQ